MCRAFRRGGLTMDELKRAERRGYSKGYVAGKKSEAGKRHLGQKAANWNLAFLAALPACFAAEGWTRGNKPIGGLEDRMKLAAEAADIAVIHMRTP